VPGGRGGGQPKRLDSTYPFDELAAVGVAFRFLMVLYEAMGRTLDTSAFIDLAALGRWWTWRHCSTITGGS
jgi:single-stranded-DNA-specific exonuclease